jgi:hypothetical protein
LALMAVRAARPVPVVRRVKRPSALTGAPISKDRLASIHCVGGACTAVTTNCTVPHRVLTLERFAGPTCACEGGALEGGEG